MTALTMPDGGSRKETFNDGYTCIYFKNGDIRQIFPTSISEPKSNVYFYKQQNITQTEYKNGERVTLFANGQIEKILNDGSKVIFYADGTKKTSKGANKF